MNTEEYSKAKKLILDNILGIIGKPIDANPVCINARMFHYADMNLHILEKFTTLKPDWIRLKKF